MFWGVLDTFGPKGPILKNMNLKVSLPNYPNSYDN